jgi:site-specific recombinase XerD
MRHVSYPRLAKPVCSGLLGGASRGKCLGQTTSRRQAMRGAVSGRRKYRPIGFTVTKSLTSQQLAKGNLAVQGEKVAKKPTMNSDELPAGFASHLCLMENRTKQTVGTYLSHVRAFCRYLADAYPSVALNEVSSFHVRAWLLHGANRGLAPITRSTALFALRSFYRFLRAEGLSETNPAAAVTLPSPIRPRVEFYTEPEADTIIEWAASQQGLRWQVGRVLLLAFRYSGLRLDELVNLRTDEVDLDARRISLVGKGRKPRVVPIPSVLASVLREYVEMVRPSLPTSPYLFANPNGARNRKLHGRYGSRSVHTLVGQAGASSGVSGRHFAHRWRHSYATSLIRRGEDIHVVQRLMGHSNIATTSRYLHLSDADLLDAVDRAFPAS